MPPKKDAPPPIFHKDHFQETIVFLIILVLIGALWRQLSVSPYNVASLWILWQNFLAHLQWLWNFIRIFAVALIGFSIWGAVYSRMKLHNIKKEEEKMYGGEDHPTILGELTHAPRPKLNDKWTKVIEHLNSNNSSEWRLAIIEADIMLDELLTSLGYHGESIGEKLKAVEPGDMQTLDAAWEAHKVRNRIAHAGSDFELNEREAKRIVALFESVFKEYQMI